MFNRVILFALVLAFAPLTSFAAEKFEEGVNYFEIFPSYPDDNKSKVTVREFFWYNCPHCFDFEPHVEKWAARKGEDVDFLRVPALFNKTARMHAEVFYALKLMGKAEELQIPIFTSIHVDKHSLDSIEVMEKFLAKHGVDIDKFRGMRQSFAVQTQVNRAGVLAKRYGISGVPNMVVDGIYRTGRTKNYTEMTELVDHLVDKVRKHKVSVAEAK